MPFSRRHALTCFLGVLSVSTASAALASAELVAAESRRLAAGLAAQKKDDSICWKGTYDRGVGLVPSYCTDPAHPSYEVGLCYQSCHANEHGVATMCILNSCPSGYTDYGLTCTYSSAGYGKGCCCTIFGCCNTNCNGNPNFYDDGGCMCQPKTIGKSWDRGIGIVPTGCSPDRHNENGLCYTSCQAGYTSFATGCWANCAGSFSFDCGMACATSEATCIQGIFDMVSSPLMLILDVATGGGAAEVTDALMVGAKALVKAAMAKLADGVAEEAVSTTIKTMATKIGKTIADSAVNKVMSIAAQTAGGDPPPADLSMLTGLDPTGISDIVLAYNHPICGSSSLLETNRAPLSPAQSVVEKVAKLKRGETATGPLTPT